MTITQVHLDSVLTRNGNPITQLPDHWIDGIASLIINIVVIKNNFEIDWVIGREGVVSQYYQQFTTGNPNKILFKFISCFKHAKASTTWSETKF